MEKKVYACVTQPPDGTAGTDAAPGVSYTSTEAGRGEAWRAAGEAGHGEAWRAAGEAGRGEAWRAAGEAGRGEAWRAVVAPGAGGPPGAVRCCLPGAGGSWAHADSELTPLVRHHCLWLS